MKNNQWVYFTVPRDYPGPQDGYAPMLSTEEIDQIVAAMNEELRDVAEVRVYRIFYAFVELQSRSLVPRKKISYE